jgi:hypothetical protein
MSSWARGVAGAALDDLDEPGVVRVTVDVDDDVVTVAERGLSGEQFGGLRPPLVLLGSVAVAPGGPLGFEAGERAPADTAGAAGEDASAANAHSRVQPAASEADAPRVREVVTSPPSW